MPSSDDQSRRAAAQRLESLAAAGVRQLPKKRPRPSQQAAAGRSGATGGRTSLFDDQPLATGAATGDTLEIIQAEVAACVRCSELVANRTQTVFGVGDPHALLCFLGEAPGADEDRLGEPFVGRAGKLLTDIIEKGMKLRRGDVYILNILKCRPPGNRNPLPQEAANCRDFLDRQLALIEPKFICCLGAVAAQNLLDTTMSIGRMRGQFYRYGEARVMCTYHPAYLLRNPAAKSQTWDDIRMLMEAMGLPVEK